MARPRVLLVPEFTEIQWSIRPEIEEWADVVSYDPPGVGGEPLPGDVFDAEGFVQAVVETGLARIDRLGWDRYFVVGDGWGLPGTIALAAARPEALAGLVLTHASLAHTTEGKRPSVNPEIYAAMTKLIRNDAPGFVRYGIAQVTKGSVDEDLAERMLERLPPDRLLEGWEAMTAPGDFGHDLLRLNCPMLLVKHEGCLMSTDEGYEDAAAALPEAKTHAVPDAPPTSPEFAEALRRFCLAHAYEAGEAPAGIEPR